MLRQLTFFLALLPAHAGVSASPSGVSVEVRPGDWGDASVGDIGPVLQSVVDVLAPHFPRHISARVVVAYNAAGPRVLARESAEGAHTVFLRVQDRRWDQFAYQFAHELCHIFSNHDQRPVGADRGSREHQWFEETLCEVVSLLALERMALQWKQSPPKAGWQSYAPAFSAYAARLLSRDHRRMPAHESVGSWYVRHRAMLQADPYVRPANEQLAASLLDLFRSTDGSLAAIGYLNLEAPSGTTFAAYLAAWRDCCPPEHRPFVGRLIELFGAA